MNEDAWRLDVLEAEIAVLDERIDRAISYLLEPDGDGYGLNVYGVHHLLNILRGESNDFGTPGFMA